MPINESMGQPSNLTEKQQREAMRAVYGLDGSTMTPNNPPNELTYEERIRMRRFLDSLDQKEAGGMKEFDLNKPPVPPYVYREYPMLLYKPDTGESRAARDYNEKQQMLAQGWSMDPKAPAPPPEIELTQEELAEAGMVDRKLREKKK